MEDFFLQTFKELSPFGFTCLVVYLHYTGLLQKIMKNLFKINGELSTAEKLATNHIPHIEEDVRQIRKDVELIRISQEKLAPYEWCEREFKEMKDDIKETIDDLENHLNKRIDDLKT